MIGGDDYQVVGVDLFEEGRQARIESTQRVCIAANITPVALTGSITAASRAYDADVDATITGRTLSGVLGTDDVSYVGGTAAFADKNVGNGKIVTATGLSLSGADAGNYTVNTSATTTAKGSNADMNRCERMGRRANTRTNVSRYIASGTTQKSGMAKSVVT